MIDAVLTFFSSFNPIVFGAALSLGAIILFRRPTPVALRAGGERPRDRASAWRRQS